MFCLHALVCLSSLLLGQDPDSLPVLRPGETVRAVINDGGTVVHSEILDTEFEEDPTIGRRYLVRITDAGQYTVDLKALLFDTYLVLRDGEGTVLDEDDDGLYGTHSRIVIQSNQANQNYTLEACALHGERGEYELTLREGTGGDLTPVEEQKILVDEARQTILLIEKRDGEESSELSFALATLAELLEAQGEQEEAKCLYERCLRIDERVHGPEAPETAVSLFNLASVLDALGDHTRAKRLLQRTVQIEEMTLGPEHPETATSLCVLADLLLRMEEYEQAQPLFERTLVITEKTHGPQHSETAKRLNLLAWVHYNQKNYGDAKPLFERVLGIQEQILGPDHPETARTLSNLAVMCQELGHFEEAESFFEQAIGVFEKVHGPEHRIVGETLSYLALLYFNNARYGQAKTLFERVIEIRKSDLGLDHPATALSLHALATVEHKLGNYSRAKLLFEQAVEIREKVLGPEDMETTTSLQNLAILLHDLGEYEASRRLFERVIKTRVKALGPEHPETSSFADHLTSLAGLLHQRGYYSEAARLYERAHRINVKVYGPEHRKTAGGLNNLAVTQVLLGDYEDAKPLLEEALRIRLKTLDPEHPDTAQTLDTLAELYTIQGNYDEAQLLHERAFEIRKKTFGPGHPVTAESLSKLALLLLYQGNYAEGQRLCEQALKIDEEALGPVHPGTARDLNNLALFFGALGDDAKAIPRFERALKIYENKLGLEHPQIAVILVNLAERFHDLGAYEKARSLKERALRIREMNFDPGHPAVAESLGILAESHIDLGEFRKACELTQRAVATGDVHLQRLLWSLPEHDRLLYASQKRWILEILLSLGGLVSSQEMKKNAYEALLHWKGRVSRSLLAGRERLAQRFTPRAEESLSRLKDIQAQLSLALFGQDHRNDQDREARLNLLRTKRRQVEEQLVREIGQVDERPLVELEDLKEALPPSSVIVDFYIHRWYAPAKTEGGKTVEKGGWSEPHLSAWVLSKGKEQLAHLDLGEAEPIRKVMADYLKILVAQGGTRGPPRPLLNTRSPGKKAAQALRALLWDPLARHLKDVETIFLSPDSFLGTCPFEVLELEDGTYLIEHHDFVYLQDMSSLPGLTRLERQETMGDGSITGSDLFVMGGVDYATREGLARPEKGATETTQAPVRRFRLTDRDEVRRSFADGWDLLEGTIEESKAIASLHADVFPSQGERFFLQGASATEERIKAEISHYRFVHLATHGFFQPECLPSIWEKQKNENEPSKRMLMEAKRVTGMLPGYLSGLVCAGASQPAGDDREDGFLTAEELTWLDLSRVDLVVLSACETGLGSPRGGEGMIGLRRSFRQAGVRTVISALWSVNDAATSELMQGFYTRLWKRGEGKLEALRGARLDMLKKNRLEHGEGLPATWGAFVLDGDWR